MKPIDPNAQDGIPHRGLFLDQIRSLVTRGRYESIDFLEGLLVEADSFKTAAIAVGEWVILPDSMQDYWLLYHRTAQTGGAKRRVRRAFLSLARDQIAQRVPGARGGKESITPRGAELGPR